MTTPSYPDKPRPGDRIAVISPSSGFCGAWGSVGYRSSSPR
ncbi:hypothetical protein ABZS81_28475 [Streptomyces sp. NPDC005318]